MRELKRELRGDAARADRGPGDRLGESAAQGAARARASTTPDRSRSRGIVGSSLRQRRAASRPCRRAARDGVAAGHAGALARRAGRPGHRGRPLRVAGAAGHRRRQHRAGPAACATASRRSRRAAATARSTSARSRSAAIRSSRGDIFITSGTGGLYPPASRSRVVTSSTTTAPSRVPLADPAALDFAIVEPPFEPAADRRRCGRRRSR